jgi:hypothetical protein
MAFSYKKDSVTYTQTVASDTWTFDHNLGTNAPAVMVWVNQGSDVVAFVPKGITVVGPNTVTVKFSSPQTGTLVVN